ncbi:hypothetical protein ACRAWD_04300 [Caulobacter segnis]
MTTAGWKHGMDLAVNRANECIKRHVHVFTHAARVQEVAPAVDFAEQEGWMPNVPSEWAWEDIPTLATDFRRRAHHTYFPIFAVDPL